MTRLLLVFVIATGLQTSSVAQGDAHRELQSPAAKAAEAKVGASIKDAMSTGRLVATGDGDLKVDRTVSVPDDTAKGSTGGKAEILYQIGTSKENTPVFLPVRTAASSSEESGEVIDAALSTIAAEKSPVTQIDVQACAGDRTCVKVCGTGNNEYCCKWKCDKQ